MAAEKKSVVQRKKNNKIAIPLLCAVGATLIFYKWSDFKVKAEVDPITVPYAAHRLDEHTEIKKEDIKFITIPKKSLPPDAVVIDPNELLGKYVGTNYTIPQNGYFYKEMLTTLEKIPSRIPKLLEKGQLGLTMRVDLERSVANSLKDNMWVQVRFYTDRTPSRLPVEGVLEEKIKILAVRDSSGQDVVKTEHEKSKVPTVVVFDASDEQASYLIRAQKLGELNVVALSEADLEKIENNNGVTGDGNTQNIGSAAPEVTNQETDAESIKKVIEGLGDKLSPEQRQILEGLAVEKSTEKSHGKKFNGNPIKLFIDSMTHNIETQFEDKYFVTPKGEVVYFDKQLNQLRYFETQEEFKESTYVLQELSPEEINQVLKSGNQQTQGGTSEQQTSNQGDQSKTTTQSPQSGQATVSKGKTFTGVDKGVTGKVHLSKGIAVLNIKYQGQGPFLVTMLDSAGKGKKVVDQKTGMYEGRTAVSIPSNDEYIFDVQGKGTWAITVE